MKFQYLGTAAAEGIPAFVCNCENCVRSREIGGRALRTRSQAIVDGKLLIGGAEVLEVPGVANQPVTVGIRPEGFNLDAEGKFVVELSNLEVMGRDVSVVSKHQSSLNPVVRSIINSDSNIDENAETVSFSLKPHKVFLFNKETEERIYF